MVINGEIEERPQVDRWPEMWAAVRHQRNVLLAGCDWTQMPDLQIDPQVKSRWAQYRQALRDITSTQSDPTLIEWPQRPA
jgi:hypothetical protein